jgi:hypothetical protein
MMPYTDEMLQQDAKAVTDSDARRSVERYVTAERLGPYLEECDGDFSCAESLYVWNLRISGAFYEALGIFEVVVRNALCEQLRVWHGKRPGSWLDDPRGVFEENRIRQIDKAQRILAQRSKPMTEGRIMAELPFGFWRYLLARRYEHTLWVPHLRHAFPAMKPQRREEVYRRVDGLHAFRNRIAHHEPIHHHGIERLHNLMFGVASWVDADMASWVQSLSRVPTVLDERP